MQRAGGYCLVAIHGLLIEGAFLVHRLKGRWAPGVAARGLSHPITGGIFPDQAIELVSPGSAGKLSIAEPPAKSSP